MTDLKHQFGIIKMAPREAFKRHPLVEKVPTLPADSDTYVMLLESIRNEGVTEPLKCVIEGDKYLVLDGIHRLAIACEVGVRELPFVEIPPEKAINTVCSALLRAGWSKSALAYRMWPMFEASCHQRGGNRRTNRKNCGLFSARDIAARLGVSERLVEQAKSVHAYFKKNPKVKEEQEASILLGERSLSRVGFDAHQPEGKSNSPVQHIESQLTKLPKAFDLWDELSHAHREHAKNRLATALNQLPKEVQETALDVLEIALQR